jgi:hypothetical protein
MSACLGQSQVAQGADATVRAVATPTPVVLAVIHIVDLPGTFGLALLADIGYLGIIAAAALVGGALIARSHWLAWA